MKHLLPLTALLMLACEDTPPSGSRTLEAPTQPVFVRSGATELLAFIDQGRDAVRFLDLTAGTYQWGTNPYFPREAAIDGSPIDLRLQGSDLIALSASGEAYAVPVQSGVPVALGLAQPTAGAHALGLVEHAGGLARLDSDCSALNLVNGAVFAALEMGQCAALGAGLFAGANGAGEQLLHLANGVVTIFAAAPFRARAARLAGDGGYWVLSADLRRLARLDASGQEQRRFALPFDVMDLVETQDDQGALLSLVGLDRGVVYMRADGVAEVPHGSRALARLITLTGDTSGVAVARDAEQTLEPHDLLLVGALGLGEALVTVAAVVDEPQQWLLTPADGEALPPAGSTQVQLSAGALSCQGLLGEGGVLLVDGGDCPVGVEVTAVFKSAGWHLFAGAALEAGASFELTASLGYLDAQTELAYGGHRFSASAVAPWAGAVASARGKNGAGSTVLADGWFSAITAAQATTNYGETEQTWLWLTSPSDDAVVQMPVKASEYYSMLIFR